MITNTFSVTRFLSKKWWFNFSNSDFLQWHFSLKQIKTILIFRHKESTPSSFLCLLSPAVFYYIFLRLARFPTCSITNASLLKVWSHPSLNVALHPHTQCLVYPPPFSLHLSLSPHHSLFPLPVCQSIPFSVSLFLPQTAVTVTWSCRRCVTSRRGWTSCRLRPSSPGRSFSLSIEASRMYVWLPTAETSNTYFPSLLCFI